MMLGRQVQAIIEQQRGRSPVVVMFGPRQVGTTMLARAIAAAHPDTLFLDLERESDRASLAQPEFFFSAHRHRLVVLDEVPLLPQVFSTLRPEIDADRRVGRFPLLSSAVGDLLLQTGEFLAGRVSLVELTPLACQRAGSRPAGPAVAVAARWLPPELARGHDESSNLWRQDFLRTFLQRDLPVLGVRTPA